MVRDRAFYEAWLKALRTLDFDKLTRNAQVDYLYIKKMAELQIARDGATLPENPPRKADASGIPGPARGRQGLIFDLQDELIPYTPEELIAIAEKEFAWCEAEMKKASRAARPRRRLEAGAREGEGRCTRRRAGRRRSSAT